MSRSLIALLVALMVLAVPATADDLYKVLIRNQQDAEQLARMGIDPVVRLAMTDQSKYCCRCRWLPHGRQLSVILPFRVLGRCVRGVAVSALDRCDHDQILD